MDEDEAFRVVLEVLQRRSRPAPSLAVAKIYDHYKSANETRKSWPAFALKLAPFLKTHGDRQADALTAMDWTLYATERRRTRVPGKHGELGRCYSETTINAELGALKAMLNWATEQGLLRFNPLAVVRRKSRKRRETAPKEREIGLALAACRTPEQVVMVLGAADVGMRRGEIIQLQHDWIDHEAKTIALPNSACKNGSGGTVPCTQRFLDAVSALPRHIRHPQVLVSPAGDGGTYGKSTIDEWWKQIRERAGLEAAPGDRAMRLHDCRAGAATNALKRGVRLQTVSKKILRHRHLATTELYLRGELDDPEETTAASAAIEAGILRDQQRRGPRAAKTAITSVDAESTTIEK